MLRSALITVLFAFSAAASAEGFDYNYLYLGYGNTDVDTSVFEADGDGFTLGGSYAFSDSIHGFISYDTADLDGDVLGIPVSVDATRWTAGVGYNRTMSDKLDMFARLSYEDIDLEAADDSGFGLGIGLRYAASEDLELNAGVNHVDYDELGDDTAFEVGGVYSFTDAFSASLSAEFGDISTYALSGRFYFGK